MKTKKNREREYKKKNPMLIYFNRNKETRKEEAKWKKFISDFLLYHNLM